MSEARMTTLVVNGVSASVTADVRTTLADALRDHLHLTGTRLGCEQGVCGSCTVLVDGASVRSCLTLLVTCKGKHVVSVEGLADGDALHPVQEAFSRHHALQCGFCTAGFFATVNEMVTDGVAADEELVRERLSGNLCRCTGYHNIVAAAMELLSRELTT
jgi:aerobic-type carbon monoxide dehydrogenase small subunit (CoxS/CutS family)